MTSNKPLQLLVTDDSGRPLPGLWPQLNLSSGITLGPTELLWAQTSSGLSLFGPTDFEGRVLLRGVDPEAPDAPTLTLVGTGLEPIPLAAYRPGDTIEIIIESEN